MKEGAIVLLALAQADGTVKPRPALVLRQLPGFGDWLVCGISTQLHQCVTGFDETIASGDADFASSGLARPVGIPPSRSAPQDHGPYRLGFSGPAPPPARQPLATSDAVTGADDGDGAARLALPGPIRGRAGGDSS